MGRVLGVLSSLFLFLGASELRAQNLVQNSGFTGGLGSWTPITAPSYTVGWDGAVGNGAPGAVTLDLPTSAGATDIFFLSQCTPAAASTLYDVGGSIRFPSSVTEVPRGSVIVQAFSDAACTTSAGGLSNFGLSFAASPPDTWLSQLYTKGYTSPTGTVAIKFILRVTTFGPGATFAWFDDIVFTPSGLDYFTLPPCRLVDTRDLGAPVGGPVLAGQETRAFAIVGNCGIPATARALSVNVAVTQPTSGGNLRLFPAGEAVPTVSTVNYSAGQTRANNAVVKLNTVSGSLSVFVGQAVGTNVHLIIDVNGYFE